MVPVHINICVKKIISPKNTPKHPNDEVWQRAMPLRMLRETRAGGGEGRKWPCLNSKGRPHPKSRGEEESFSQCDNIIQGAETGTVLSGLKITTWRSNLPSFGLSFWRWRNLPIHRSVTLIEISQRRKRYRWRRRQPETLNSISSFLYPLKTWRRPHSKSQGIMLRRLPLGCVSLHHHWSA